MFHLVRADAESDVQNILDELWQDLVTCRMELFWLCVLAFFSALLMLVLLWCAPRLLIWGMMCGIVVTCLAGTIWLWVKWILEADTHVKHWLYYAIGSSVACLVLGLVIIVIWRKVSLVLQLLHEAGEAVSSMLFLLCIPILTIITLLATFSIGACFVLLIESAGEARLVANSVLYVKDPLVLLARWYNIMALVWFSQFLLSCQHVVTAGAVAMWYFARFKSQLGNVEGRSFFVLLRYHLGTVALGSFLIAISQLFRLVFKILWCTTKKNRSTRCTCCARCCLCCVGCLLSLMEVISRRAYILTALRGQSFCKAGKSSFQLVVANGDRFFAVETIGSIVLVLVKLFVLFLVGFIGMELMHRKQELHHPYIMLAIAGTVVFLIAHCCMNMYEMTIDTIFICFCKDIELNDGVERPYFMSRNLERFVQVSSKGLADTNQAGTSHQAS